MSSDVKALRGAAAISISRRSMERLWRSFSTSRDAHGSESRQEESVASEGVGCGGCDAWVIITPEEDCPWASRWPDEGGIDQAIGPGAALATG